MPSLSTFSTARLRAEQLTEALLPEIRLMDTDARFMAMLGGTRDEAASRAYMDRNLAHWATFGFGLWVLRERESGRLAGRACVRHLDLDGQDEMEIGYGFFPEFWRQGLGTEIARECARVGLEDVGAPSVVALTLPENLGSRRVMTNAGLAFEREITHGGGTHVLYRRRA
ncbi:MAG: GNAT family N-acetyltransferase [Gemmatimonadota bacterium]